MRILLTAVLFVFAVVAVSLPVRGRSGLVEVMGSAERQAAESARLRIPVVVELFTSEGCSSCPPADELLERLDEKQLIPGVEVIALEQHVDYWNSLGWNDPFSSSRFSERQNDYSISFGHSGVYTPQMIVDGTVEFVGSSKQQALASIAESARQPKVKVQLEFGKDRGGGPPVDMSIWWRRSRRTVLLPISRGEKTPVYGSCIEQWCVNSERWKRSDQTDP